jgi:DNA polymerase III subunit beta
MKLRIDQKTLADTARWASRQLPERPVIPALACLLLDADSDRTTLSGFDHETSTRTGIAADVITPGRVLVSGRLLADVIGSMPPGPVDLVADEQALHVTAPGSRFHLPLAELADYPTLPQPPAPTGTVDGAAFAQAVGHVAPSVLPLKDAVGTAEAFGGVCLRTEGERLLLVATDRYRYAVRSLPWQPAVPADGAIVMPADMLKATARAMSGSEKLTLSMPASGSGTAALGDGTLTVTTRLMEGAHPDPGVFRKRLDTDTAAGSIVFDPAELAAAAKRVALVSDVNAPIRLSVNGQVATLAGGSSGPAGSTDIEVAADGDVDGFAIAFNPEYLASLLAPLDSPARMWLWTSTKPALIQPADGDPGYWAVLMSVRLK